MLQIKPTIEHEIKCPRCNLTLPSRKVIFQGIHIITKHSCKKCGREYFSDLPVGHAIDYPYKVNPEEGIMWGSETSARNWFGIPLLKSLQKPNYENINLKIIKHKPSENIILLNCLDYLYGHSLLKLLNADRLIKNKKNVVVIIPQFLEWMVPKGVVEAWIVKMSLRNSLDYYPALDRKIKKQLKRFNQVCVDKALSHPSEYDITNFTGVKKHDFEDRNFRISYIWREDRPWVCNDYLVYGLKKLKMLKPLVFIQYLKVFLHFMYLKMKLPKAKYTIVGKGRSFIFPGWIDDQRVNNFSPKIEKKLCKIYSESRVVIGVHGSNMLLPSAHAGMVVDLLPSMRMGNFAQDVLYQEKDTDPRMISFKYRYMPISISFINVAKNVKSMMLDYKKTLNNYENRDGYKKNFT